MKQGAKEGALAIGGKVGAGGGGGDGDDVLPSRDGCRWWRRRASFGDERGGGDCGRWHGGRGDSENGDGLDFVVASLLELEEQGFFRSIVRFL